MAVVHEQNGEDDVAVRRYMEALTLDPSHGGAYMGLGALRFRRAELQEAERVYSVALAHRPDLDDALLARGRVRWALSNAQGGQHDMQEFFLRSGRVDILRELADWQGRRGNVVAQLAVWRQLRAVSQVHQDAELAHQATVMVRALQILAGSLDPAALPVAPTPARRALSSVARRQPE